MVQKRSVQGASLAALLLALPAAAQTAQPPTHIAIPLDTAAADRFSGYYLVGPDRSARFWREGDHFYFGQVGTPQKAETFEETPTRFFFGPVVSFTFTTASDGTVGLVINQAGRDIAATRITEAAANALAAAPPPPPVARTWKVLILTPKKITNESADALDAWPCFSPDGRTVLFSHSSDGGKSWTLFKVPSGGGAATPFFAQTGVSGSRPSWSKSGHIAFDGSNLDPAAQGIWIANGDGSGARALTVKGLTVPTYASWFPDGKSIGLSDGATNILYRMNVDGGAVTALTDQKQVLAGMMSISPDGTTIVLAGQKNIGQVYNQNENQIWLVENGQARPVEQTPGQGRAPTWSPDGKRIVFESGRGSPDGKYAVFIINQDGSGLTQLTDYALNAFHPVFSQDGKRVVFGYGSIPGQPNGIAVVDLPDPL